MKRVNITHYFTFIFAISLNFGMTVDAKKRHPSQHTTKEEVAAAQTKDLQIVPNEIKNFGISPQKEARPQQSILSTMQRELQTPQYRQDILPHNFSYLMQLLRYGSTTKQSAEYAQQVISLFSKLLKGSEYVNSYVFADLVRDIPELLKPYFNVYTVESSGTLLLANDLDMLERLQKTVSHLVVNKFTQDFDVCRKNPRKFLDDLSSRVVAATTQEVNMELLRQMLIRFLEVGLSKLVWSPRDEERSWESVKSLSHRLATLMEQNVIGDLNDLDELYWSLLHRYRYFLELHSSNLPLSFFDSIKADIAGKKVLMLELEEQEPFMQSKASCLLNTVLSQEAKKRAHEYGVEPQVM